MKVFKRLAAMGAVMMMASVSAIGASAYSKTYLGRTNASTGTTPRYISCYHTGAFTNGYVSGMAWNKTSTTNNVLNPNCSFNGYIFFGKQHAAVYMEIITISLHAISLFIVRKIYHKQPLHQLMYSKAELTVTFQ